MSRILRLLPCLCVFALLAGCASIDFDYPRTESNALADTAETSLGKVFDPNGHTTNGTSGFHSLLDDVDALAARISLAEQAEASIDVQYYLIKNDVTGSAFMEALLRAADRGVRVRVLLDDVFTSGYDLGMAALESHPEIEIRVFNPFNRGFAGRALGSVTDFRRINRRMHNKSFTVDNQVTIIGGRNIADEYFGARADHNFGDHDVIGVGPVVREVSAMFDLYWNHAAAVPVMAFLNELDDPDAELNIIRERLAGAYDRAPTSAYDEAVRSKYRDFLESDAIEFEWTPYRLVYDSPDKGLKDREDDTPMIVSELFDALSRTEKEMIIVSPYFVPLDLGVDRLVAVRERGIEVTVITNSLAANNQFSVHAGYAPSRKPLLEAGVRIYEIRPDAVMEGTTLVAASGAKATLHTKAFLIDRTEVFVGSFNFDPRSAWLNCEMGVLIENQAMAQRFADYVHSNLPDQAYELFLNEDGKLRWRAQGDGGERIYEKEPETSWWDRFVVGLVRLLPVKRQL